MRRSFRRRRSPEASAHHARGQWPRPVRRQDSRLGLEGRQEGRPQVPRLSSGTARATRRCSTTTFRAAMIELFGSALVTFLVIIDPPGCAPIFASLTRGTTAAHRRAMAIRSSLIAWAILMFFALLGRPMLHALGHQPGELSNRRRNPALLHRLRHDLRAAHRAPREARRGDRGDARGRGHQRLPDGDSDDHRPWLDRQRDAVGQPSRRCSPQSRLCLRRSRR